MLSRKAIVLKLFINTEIDFEAERIARLTFCNGYNIPVEGNVNTLKNKFCSCSKTINDTVYGYVCEMYEY